jgi:hypothetical protein
METSVPGYEWLDDLLDRDLQSIAEELEAGGKISPADFARLVEFHRENCPVNDNAPPTEWCEASAEPKKEDTPAPS